ncbi:MAG: heparinase II/III family protein [Verrucomicrobiota bacterium]
MPNLLSSPLDADALTTIFGECPPASPLPALGDARWTRAFALSASDRVRGVLLDAALAERDLPLPELTDALYADYAATGTRLTFENLYFERRSRLARAALALLATGRADPSAESRSFVAKLEEILAESSWALPAHVDNPTGRDARIVDLFAARTANILAEYLRVFAAVMPADLTSRVRTRLRRDVFEAYLDRDFFWLENTNNWNAVCHQGILGAALAVEDDAGLIARLCLKLRTALPRFLDGFGPDGACSEGPSYWDFGFGWFAGLNQQVETRTGGRLSLFEGNPTVPLMAGYAPAMSLEDGGLVNFSDCAAGAALRPHILQYLGERLELPACRHQARVQLRARLSDGVNPLVAERTDFFFWGRCLLAAPEIIAADGAGDLEGGGTTAPDAFYSSLGLWVVRGRDAAGHLWELAAKGGHNDEHHNHNDVGSFILSIDGVPLITEIGRPEYVRDYFWGDRYAFLAARSLGHSLPLVNGTEQAAGRAHAAPEPAVRINADVVSFEADIAAAWPARAGLARLVRRLELDKRAGCIRWIDTASMVAPGVVDSGLITHAEEVEIVSPRLARIRRAGRVINLEAASGCVWSGVEAHTYCAHRGETGSCRRVLLVSDGRLPANRFEFTVVITLGPKD